MWLALLGSSYFWLQALWAIWLLSYAVACSFVLWAVVSVSFPTFARKLRNIVKSSSGKDSLSLLQARKEHYDPSFDY